MGYKLNLENMNLALNKLKKTYKIYAPKVFEGAGTFSDTDRVRYGEVSTIEEIEFNEKSSYSYKETILPIRQTLFFFLMSLLLFVLCAGRAGTTRLLEGTSEGCSIW